MERLVNKRYDAWLATSISIPQMVIAEALFQCVRGMVIATGIWVASLLMGASGNPLPLLASFIPMMLVGWTCAMLGYCTAAAARSFSDIELVEPLLTAAFVFSGVFVSLSTFAWPLQWFGMALPIFHGIEVMRPLFMGTAQVGTMALHLGILILMAGGSTWLAIRLFRRRLVD
jgi:lipooligosaccharide transport system permease protein